MAVWSRRTRIRRIVVVTLLLMALMVASKLYEQRFSPSAVDGDLRSLVSKNRGDDTVKRQFIAIKPVVELFAEDAKVKGEAHAVERVRSLDTVDAPVAPVAVAESKSEPQVAVDATEYGDLEEIFVSDGGALDGVDEELAAEERETHDRSRPGAKTVNKGDDKKGAGLEQLQSADKQIARVKSPNGVDTRRVDAEIAGNVHVFYYAWYGTPKFDRKWFHWNHRVLEEGGKEYVPPEDIGANFYPAIGPYSSNDERAITSHMRGIRASGIDVVVVSWYPPGLSDDNGGFSDSAVLRVLDLAELHGLRVCFHVEPFNGRNAQTMRNAVKYAIDTYGNHPGLYRDRRRGNRPWFYVYDSYHTKPDEWATLLTPAGRISLRGSEYDAVFIALYVNEIDREMVSTGGFDGMYSYFATDGFVSGSTTRNWQGMRAFTKNAGALWVPSVGPGYIDTRIRPWNSRNARSRDDGAYYRRMFQAAIRTKPDVISITSWNEWHEGTQIEAAVSKRVGDYSYESYPNDDKFFYIRQTATHVRSFRDTQENVFDT